MFSQKPDATLVTGFRKWQSLGRQVRRGEKGIAIFAPCKYLVESENEAGGQQNFKEIRGFKAVHVFDITQTDGESIEDLSAIAPKLLSGDTPPFIWDALVAVANDNCFEVVRHQKGNENGYCDFPNLKIAVRPDVEPLQAIKTLVHELGHALLHSNESLGDRDRQEVEVESVAYIVLDALGLDSSPYSFPYVARWLKTTSTSLPRPRSG